MAASKTIISMPLLLTHSFSRCPSSRTSFPPITAHLVLSNLVPTNINMAALVIIGSVNADIVLHIKTLPAKGETLDAARPDTGFMVPGGKGANQAVASARLSSEATRAEMVCRFGSDAHGETLHAALTGYGVGTGCSSHCEDTPSGQAYIFLHPGGDNSILLVGGANRDWPSVRWRGEPALGRRALGHTQLRSTAGQLRSQPPPPPPHTHTHTADALRGDSRDDSQRIDGAPPA